ncbi:MAG: DUF3108 domain-containing protein, partial [Calditrichaeota bacterium]
MKISILSFILYSLLLNIPLNTQAFPQQHPVASKEALLKNRGNGTAETSEPVLPPLRELDNQAFGVGEKLDYIIRYGSIKAGYSRLSIPEVINFKGYPCYRIISEAWSNKFFSRFYKVQDHVESYVDVRGIFSWRLEKHLREGSYRKDLVVYHDQLSHLAYADGDTFKIPPFVHDVLSAMYYVRTLTLSPGDTVLIDNQDNAKVYPLQIVVHKREKIKIKAGKFTCLVVEPHLKTPALFKQKGRIVVHLT